MSDIKAFLEDLKKINSSDCFEVYVPSLKKTALFKAFSVKQHKDVVRTILDGVEGTVSLSKLFNEIIEENSVDPIDFKIYDKNKILIDLRKQCVSEVFKINEEEYNLNKLPEYKFNFKLKDKFEYKNIEVEVELPSLKTDTKITEKSITEFNKFTTEDKKINNSLTILLIYEVMKFITKIKMEDTIINFKDLGTFDKKNIIENLPLKLNNDILEYIAKYKQYETKLLTFDSGSTVSIDASFLSNE